MRERDLHVPRFPARPVQFLLRRQCRDPPAVRVSTHPRPSHIVLGLHPPNGLPRLLRPLLVAAASLNQIPVLCFCVFVFLCFVFCVLCFCVFVFLCFVFCVLCFVFCVLPLPILDGGSVKNGIVT